MIKLIIYIVIAILVLSFFGISLQGIIESPAGQANIDFVWNLILIAWNFIWDLLLKIWDFVVFWK